MFHKLYAFKSDRVKTVPLHTRTYHSITWSTIRVAFGVGSMDDPPGKEGLTHLVEHILSALIDNLSPQQSKLIKTVDDRVDALTTPTCTMFGGVVLDMNTEAIFSMLAKVFFIRDCANKYRREIEKIMQHEKGVAIQEILQQFLPKRFAMRVEAHEELGLSREMYAMYVDGTPQSVNAITLDDVLQHIEKYFSIENMLIAYSGPRFGKDIDALIYPLLPILSKESLSTKTFSSKIEEKKCIEVPKKNPMLFSSVDRLGYQVDQADLYYTFCFNGDGNGGDKKIKNEILAGIVKRAIEEYTYDELREKQGVIYTPAVNSCRYKGIEVAQVRIDCDPQHAQKVVEFLQEMPKVIHNQEIFSFYHRQHKAAMLKREISSTMEVEEVVRMMLRYGQTYNNDQQIQVIEGITFHQYSKFIKENLHPKRSLIWGII